LILRKKREYPKQCSSKNERQGSPDSIGRERKKKNQRRKAASIRGGFLLTWRIKNQPIFN